jgi:squalene-hopene/tetraprenyl-beta-curcumene cyclase
MFGRMRRFQLPLTGLLLATLTAPSASAEQTPPRDPARPAEVQAPLLPAELSAQSHEAIRRGLAFLKSTQEPHGGWTARFGPAITAIAAQAFIQSPDYGPHHPVVARAVNHAMSFAQKDGGVYQPGANLANYQTSVVLMMLAARGDPAQRPALERARAFLQSLQFDENESVDPANPWYGGAGYTERKRPDLSNTQMMLDALRQSGLPPSDPTYQKALRFISRCQMFGETNDQPFARGSTDGGFVYSAANEGESKAGARRHEGRQTLRSYGSMTYSGYKSLLYAGLSRDDPRVRAAEAWIRRHWTLEANPNMPARQAKEGLYYYYHVFARALRAAGEPIIEDERGKKHHWRIELCRTLLSLQNRDGSWVNSADRWQEGDASYVTALAALTLQEALRE